MDAGATKTRLLAETAILNSEVVARHYSAIIVHEISGILILESGCTIAWEL